MVIAMSSIYSRKKPASKDWHPADIKAHLEKAGWSLSKLSRRNGYCRSAAALALRMPWPKMERLIAHTIGESPKTIWPTRYDNDGNPLSGRGQRGIGRKARVTPVDDSTAGTRRNVNERQAA